MPCTRCCARARTSLSPTRCRNKSCRQPSTRLQDTRTRSQHQPNRRISCRPATSREGAVSGLPRPGWRFRLHHHGGEPGLGTGGAQRTPRGTQLSACWTSTCSSGSVSTYLDLPRREAVMEMLSETESMDEELFGQALQPFQDKAAGADRPVARWCRWIFLSPDDIARVIEMARSHFDFVVIDMPHTLVQWSETVLQHRPRVFLRMIELDMRSAQNALRMKRALQSEDLPFEKAALCPEPGARSSPTSAAKAGSSGWAKALASRSTCNCPTAASRSLQSCRSRPAPGSLGREEPVAQGNRQAAQIPARPGHGATPKPRLSGH